MRKFYPKFLAVLFALMLSSAAWSQVSVTATSGTPGPTSYTTLKGAFDAINAGTHQGAVTISISANTTETAQALLSASGTGASVYTSVLIKPSTGATPVISGAISTPMIDLNGADNVTIDGSNTNGGVTKDLTITNTGTSNTIRLINGATGNIIKNSVLKGATTGSGVIVVSGSTAATGNNNNLIQNNDITKSGSAAYLIGIFTTGTSGKPNTGNIYRGNRITEFSLVGFSEGFAAQSVAGYSSNTLVEGNEFYQLTTRTTAISGIRVDHATGISNITISKNYIHDMLTTYVAAAPPASYVTGIDVYDAVSANVVNNMIIMDVPTSEVLNGIAIQTGTGAAIKVYYNTVVVKGNTTGANVSYAFLKNYTSTGDDVKNNIFMNTRVNAGTGKQAAIGHFSSGTMTSNYNDLYSVGNANNFTAVNTAGDHATLAAWQAASGQDVNSVTVLPVFVSATDLHLVAASNPGLDSKGISVAGFTTDYDNETRSVTPDLGADEMPASADVTGPAISFTPLTFTCSSADRTVVATIADATGVPTTGGTVPRIYYRKGAGTWYSQPGSLTSGNSNSGNWTFTIVNADMGGVTNGDVIQYYIIAQDLVATPNVSSSPSGATASNVNTVTAHPATPSSYAFGAALNGTYTVGSAGNYLTITAAVNAYNQACLAGPVVFSLTDASYSTAEAFPLMIANPLASSVNTLTIKPAPGINTVITSTTSAEAVFHLKGADYVTIDGSNTVGGSSRNLTITTTTANVGALVWISSADATNGATNNTIKNTVIYGNSPTTPAGIVTGGSAFGTGAEAANSGNSIVNNLIYKVANGMYLYGASTNDQSWVISKNELGSASAPDKISVRGILLYNMQNFSVTDNKVAGIVTATSETATATGISLGQVVINGQVSGNKISDIKNINPAGYGSNGIQLSGTGATANISVYNNFISDVASQGFAGGGVADNGYGIIVSSGSGYNISYNTVLMNTNQSLATGRPAAFNVTSGVNTAGALNVRNNLFINTQTTGNERYAIYSGASSNVFASIDFNDYYSTGPNLGFIVSNRSNLAAIQAGFGSNINSVSALPVFVSATDLHLAASGNAAVEDKGTPIASITTDIDNDARNSSSPDLGADELVTVCAPPVINMQPVPMAACEGAAASFTVSATGTGLTYQWRRAGVDVSGATSATLSISSVTAADAGNYDVVITGGCGNVTSAAVALTVNPKPVAAYTFVAGTPCNAYNFTNTSTVAAGTIASTEWSFGDGNTSTSANPSNSFAAAGTYNVRLIVTSSLGCKDSITQTVNVNAPPSITTQPANQTSCTGGNISFTVTANGSALTYQWYKGTTPIPGATTSTYTITGVTASDAANYYVVVSGACAPAATSNTVSLTINSAPVIGTQPTAVTACTGNSATFTVAATGSTLTYQWRKGGTPIAGATSSSYTIATVAASDAGSYDVVVSSTSCGTSVTSTAATLTVTSGTSITTHPVSQSVCPGANVSFSVVASGSGLTYQWKKNGVNISAATNSTLNLNSVAAGDAGTYTVEVASSCGTVLSNGAVLTVGSGTGWTGVVNNDWNNAGNWCNGVPTATTDITISSGTPNAPTINATANIRNLTLGTGVTLTITASGRLNIHGDFINNGTLSATSGTVAFQGTTGQNVATLTAGTVIVNGGGITLTGNMTAGNMLTLTAGNIVTGNNTVTLNGSTAGSLASHIVTTGLGAVIVNNVQNAVTVPVGPTATSYNPAILSNGQGISYTVKVATGITPAILNNSKGINRTWAVIPATAPASPVTITLQYNDTEANASAVGSAAMDIGVHNGTAWYLVSQPGGVTPTGGATNRQVTMPTIVFGTMAIANVGGIGTLTSLPSVDVEITSAVLTPNAFESNTILRLYVKRSMKVNWSIMDAQGRVVMTFSSQAFAGENNIPLMLRHLSNGTYYLQGYSDKGRTEVLRFVRL